MNNFTFRSPLANLLSKNWWIVLLRGIAALIFGLLTWFYPFITIIVMVIFFGVYALIDGVMGVIISINGRKSHQDWWLMLIWGYCKYSGRYPDIFCSGNHLAGFNYIYCCLGFGIRYIPSYNCNTFTQDYSG